MSKIFSLKIAHSKSNFRIMIIHYQPHEQASQLSSAIRVTTPPTPFFLSAWNYCDKCYYFLEVKIFYADTYSRRPWFFFFCLFFVSVFFLFYTIQVWMKQLKPKQKKKKKENACIFRHSFEMSKLTLSCFHFFQTVRIGKGNVKTWDSLRCLLR